jgi:hypothetical protein
MQLAEQKGANMDRNVTFLAAALLSAGCASSSGVFQVGPDTYQITTTAITSFGGAGSARGSAIRTATEHWAHLGKRPINVDTATDSQFTHGSSDVSLRCVDYETDGSPAS